MNRRAKLNLTPDREMRKKQPAGFDKTPTGGEENVQETSQTRSNPDAAQASASEPKIEMPEVPAWMDGKKLLKVALVVAAAGLSIYFLKRRFFT